MKRKSQEAKVLAWLQKGRTITHLQAESMFGCSRVAARINDIKERIKESVNYIEKEMITTKSGKRVARYRMV
jgi:hypothetical protein